MHGIITGKLNEECNRETCWCLKEIYPVSQTLKIIMSEGCYHQEKKNYNILKINMTMHVSFLLYRVGRMIWLACFTGISWGFIFMSYYLISKINLMDQTYLKFRYLILERWFFFFFISFTFQLEILLVNPQNAAIIRYWKFF